MWIVDRILTWWRGQTLNTQVWTALYGQKVGEDDQGNVYYQSKDAKRRWVIYNGESEASRVPVEWHGWLHHQTDDVPGANSGYRREWQIPYQPNLTGTTRAYRPPGHVLSGGKRDKATGDYEAWKPE